MHEMSIAIAALEIMEQAALKHSARRILAVWIEVDASACVEPEAIAACFEVVCAGGIAQGCALHLEQSPIRARCLDCGHEFDLGPGLELPCPLCAGRGLRLEGGRGMVVNRMEIEE
ncbi:MAG: hydrogenase maturation nickel metallochaperone HypA [Deltaproteobacteria bacterium]|jgi:hydrogenase nickel incorporation protein HypA/HybF|nr:hydrogenase maturation nickel metallochaperone HypA [Deltaproteobacteria bacterium]